MSYFGRVGLHRFVIRTSFVIRHSSFVICTCLLMIAGAPDPAHCGDAAQVEIITNSIGMKLAHIPAGKFVMGSPRGEAERVRQETPHEVSITKPFFMGVYEVTQAEYAKIMGGQVRSQFVSGSGGGPDHPMENLEWTNAAEFCRKLSASSEESGAGRKYRLPTEAEWEYACRAGTTTAFHYGDSLSPTQANFNGNYPYGDAQPGPYLRRTAKVGSFEPNAFGLYDMHGNVAEWCADWFDPEYYNDSPAEDPLGPPVGVLPDNFGNFYLVVRGGSWLDDARACRSAYRQRAMHRNRYQWIGFRVVCEVGN
jgi:formylglycine-generating enzyme required for sulfatase activity